MAGFCEPGDECSWAIVGLSAPQEGVCCMQFVSSHGSWSNVAHWTTLSVGCCALSPVTAEHDLRNEE
jgi:hypothetical protein